MADRVVVLSRRPGRVLDDVPMRAPAAARRVASSASPPSSHAVDRIWGLIKRRRRRAARATAGGARLMAAARIAVARPRRVPRAGASTPPVRVARAGGRSSSSGSCSRALGWVPALFLPSPLGVLRGGRGHGACPASSSCTSPRASSAWLGLRARRRRRRRRRRGGRLLLARRGRGQPLIAATFPIPKIALLPLLILWLGIGEASKVAVIALGVFFPMAINTYAGVRQADPLLVRAAVAFGAGRWSVIRKVVLPSALPMVFAGLRLGAGTALLLLVAAEMIAADSGIGFLVLHAGNLMETTKLMVGIVVLSLLGVLSHWGLSAARARGDSLAPHLIGGSGMRRLSRLVMAIGRRSRRPRPARLVAAAQAPRAAHEGQGRRAQAHVLGADLRRGREGLLQGVRRRAGAGVLPGGRAHRHRAGRRPARRGGHRPHRRALQHRAGRREALDRGRQGARVAGLSARGDRRAEGAVGRAACGPSRTSRASASASPSSARRSTTTSATSSRRTG